MSINDNLSNILLAEKLRPTLKEQNYLLGSAKKIWERDLHQW